MYGGKIMIVTKWDIDQVGLDRSHTIVVISDHLIGESSVTETSASYDS